VICECVRKIVWIHSKVRVKDGAQLWGLDREGTACEAGDGFYVRPLEKLREDFRTNEAGSAGEDDLHGFCNGAVCAAFPHSQNTESACGCAVRV